MPSDAPVAGTSGPPRSGNQVVVPAAAADRAVTTGVTSSQIGPV